MFGGAEKVSYLYWTPILPEQIILLNYGKRGTNHSPRFYEKLRNVLSQTQVLSGCNQTQFWSTHVTCLMYVLPRFLPSWIWRGRKSSENAGHVSKREIICNIFQRWLLKATLCSSLSFLLIPINFRKKIINMSQHKKWKSTSRPTLSENKGSCFGWQLT